MAPWIAGTTVTREEAIRLIKEKARSEGLPSAFKVYYEGNEVVNPTSLPEQVDMSLVRVSAVFDQA